MIVKDEVRDIAEWLAFYRFIGFDTLLLYDNGSADGTSEIIDAAARQFDVRRTVWNRTDARSQMDAYEDACRRWVREFDWIGFFDSDEFLILHGSLTLDQFLDRSPAIGAVVMNWAMFESNGHTALPPGLVIESLAFRKQQRPVPAGRNQWGAKLPHLPAQPLFCPLGGTLGKEGE